MTEKPLNPFESKAFLFTGSMDSDSESDSLVSFSSFFTFSSPSDYSGDELWSEISLSSISDVDESTNKINQTTDSGSGCSKENESVSTADEKTTPNLLRLNTALFDEPIGLESQEDLRENEGLLDFQSGNSNDPVDLSCGICGDVFGNQAVLDVHRLNHLATKPYTCLICNHISQNRGDWDLHNQIHEKNMGLNSTGTEKLPPAPYRCEECGKTFHYQSSYKRHMDRHVKPACPICGESFPTQLLCHQHKLTHHSSKKENKCRVCGKKFQRAHQLNVHMAVHAEVKEYRCEECDTSYCYRTSLVRHVAKYHSPDAPKFQCRLCGELFKNKKMLNGHEILHTAKKLIQCPDCSQTFKYRSSFHRHRVIHSSEKPFKCGTCGNVFRTESEMKKHKLQHIVNDEFVCKICDKSFAFESFLNKHMLVHEDGPSTVQLSD